MNFWDIILGVGGGIVLAWLLILILFGFFPGVYRWFRKRIYKYRAWKHNRHARKLRLAQDNWQGIPLPMGKEGVLVITEMMQMQFPHSRTQFDKLMFDRAQDLGVTVEIDRSPLTRNIVVKWYKGKYRGD